MKKFSTGRRQAFKTIGAALAASALPAPFLNLRAQEHNFSGKTLRLLTWSDDT
jgi:putative spermidine/putrescine transport system substrate-binding protein